MKDQHADVPADHGTRPLSLAEGLLILLPISLLGNFVGLALRYPDVGAAVLFPPYAALTSLLLVSRRRNWVWYIVGSSVTHFLAFWPQFSLSWVVWADAANIARALVAAVLLQRFFRGSPHLNSIRALSLFVFCAVLVAPAVAATIGAANVVLHRASPDYWHSWSAWFISNALTGLVILPAFIIALEYIAGWRRLRVNAARVAEALALAIALGATCAFAFLGGGDPGLLAVPLYAPLPVLIWAALRFGAGGASLTLMVVTFAAIWSVDRATGPFAGGSLDSNVLTLQVFALLTTAPVLCLAATAAARQGMVDLHRALLASLQDHVAILDSEGIVVEVNDSWRRFATSAARLFHRVREGDDYVTACRSGAEHGDMAAAGVLAGLTSVLNGPHRRFEIEYGDEHGGRIASYTLSVEALERSDGGAVVTRADITARRRVQMEMEEQRREVSYLARVTVLGQLSGAIAHELNQPLTAILSNAQTAQRLLEHRPPDLEEVADIMRDIVGDDKRAAAVIQRLRELLKRGDTRLQPVDARELLGEVLDLSRTELMTRQVNATATIESSLPTFLGDRVQLQQVLLNLILNGCEAMSATAPPKRRLVLTAAADSAGAVRFAVRDCGTGIPPEIIDRLFEPFVTTKSDGLGLGLSISRTIVTAHGGRLWAENNDDGGATLYCVLPVMDPSRPVTGARNHQPPAAVQAGSG